MYYFKEHKLRVNKIKYNPHNNFLYSCSDDKKLRVWSLD